VFADRTCLTLARISSSNLPMQAVSIGRRL
jgi:hypothetical protein